MDWWTLSFALLWFMVIGEAIAILILARAIGAVVLGSRDAIERDGLPIGQRAPDFEAVDADGQPRNLQELLGTPSALVFASPSCPICRRLLPGLVVLSQRVLGKASIVILLRGSIDDVRLMKEDTNATLPVWSIGHHGVAENFGARVSPYVQVIDGSGMVRAKGLVNNIDHVEHMLFEAGVRDSAISHHASELAPTVGG